MASRVAILFFFGVMLGFSYTLTATRMCVCPRQSPLKTTLYLLLSTKKGPRNTTNVCDHDIKQHLKG